MKFLFYAMNVLAALCLLALFGSWGMCIWTGDARWGGIAAMLILPTVIFAIVGTLSVDGI